MVAIVTAVKCAFQTIFLHVWCKFTWLGPKLDRFKICWCIWTILEKVAGARKCTTEIIFICCFDYCYLVQPKPSTLPWWIQGFSTLALIWIWDKQWMQWPNVVYFLSVFVFLYSPLCVYLPHFCTHLHWSHCMQYGPTLWWMAFCHLQKLQRMLITGRLEYNVKNFTFKNSDC